MPRRGPGWVKPVKVKELRDLSDEELSRRLAELDEERFNLRFQRAVGEVENPVRLRHIRRDIARIRTVQRERRPGGGGAGGAR